MKYWNPFQWLHGPNAEGRCPNCENACSLEGGTLSLASPPLLPSSQVPKTKQAMLKPARYPSSPLSALQPHKNDTLTAGPPPLPKPKSYGGRDAESTSSSSTAASVDTNTADEDNPISNKLGVAPWITSTTPFSTSWGAVSRLMSLLTFLMFVYKLLS